MLRTPEEATTQEEENVRCAPLMASRAGCCDVRHGSSDVRRRGRAQSRGPRLQAPDQIRWNPPSAAGAQNAVLVGDPSKPGLYVVRNKWLKGNHFSKPHFHPNDRFITVIDGTWWVGSGVTFDPDNSAPMPAGTFVTHFGKQVHWDGAKDEDATLLIVGEGPGTSTRVEPATGRFSKLDPAAVAYTLARYVQVA